MGSNKSDGLIELTCTKYPELPARYDFVRQLRSRIDNTLTPLIDKKLERLDGREGDRNNTLPVITEEIIASPE